MEAPAATIGREVGNGLSMIGLKNPPLGASGMASCRAKKD